MIGERLYLAPANHSHVAPPFPSMTTRWFVEVSTVDADTLKERYCIEALQWQQALQQARKLRGDRGALSRFAIELLEAGYRATDPTARLRYVVSKAPLDAPLSGASATNGASSPHAALEPPTDPDAILLNEDDSVPPTPRAAASAPASAAAGVQPHPVRLEPITEPEPLSRDRPAEPKPEPVPSLPGLDLISLRKEEPTEGAPIVYREFAFSVSPGLAPKDLERYARATWEQVRTAIAHRPPGKFVQIALFDHRFAGRPDRPPVATLAWKDWRGNPVVHIRDTSPGDATAPGHPVEAAVSQRAPVAAPHPAPGDAAGHPVVVVHAVPGPHAAPLAGAAPAQLGTVAFPQSQAPAVPSTNHAPPRLGAPVLDPGAAAAPESHADVARQGHAPPPPSVPSGTSAFPAPGRSAGAPRRPEHTPGPRSDRTPSSPSRRRGPTEDLIGELFEGMHQLRFMPDTVSGAEYVLNVLSNVMPSSGILVHVFDINTRQFVVVRALGPSSASLLLRKTADTFPIFREAFRRGRTIHFPKLVPGDGFEDGRFGALGVDASSALCGPVKEGGRYLGVIELANPAGGVPFHDGEVNALDYICEQFADFVATHPVIIDDDAVIPKT